MNQQSNNPAPFLTLAAAWAALAGVAGGLIGFAITELIIPEDKAAGSLTQLFMQAASWSAVVGLVIGLVVLIQDNLTGLRGNWYRDLALALPIFLILSFAGGIAGQLVYSLIGRSAGDSMFAMVLGRAIGWTLMGLGVGAGIGLARGDFVQSQRGGLGGAIGGAIGGFIFDGIGQMLPQDHSGALSRAVGLVIMGALVGALIRVVQDVMRDAWILCISTGPYEGKEFLLNSKSVSVGAGPSNAVVLNRLTGLPPKLGEFVFQNDGWWWRGEVVEINGVPQMNAPLRAGNNVKLGGAIFRFQERSARAPVMASEPAAQAWPPPPVAPPYPAPPSYPPPVTSPAWGSPPPAATVQAAPPPAPRPPAATVPVSPAPPAATVPVSPPAAGPAATLVSSTGAVLRRFGGSGGASVGRVGGNDIVLADGTVSSRHAQFQWDIGRITLTDLGSTNGTFVNGQRLHSNQPRTLAVGDKLKFGQLECTLQLQS